MRKYFFGYLFVRIAKFLAIVVVIIAICYALFKLAQGNNAADSVRYQRSVALQQHLSKLTEQFTNTTQLLTEFATQTQISLPKTAAPSFASDIASNADFERLTDELNRTDQKRQAMKQALVVP